MKRALNLVTATHNPTLHHPLLWPVDTRHSARPRQPGRRVHYRARRAVLGFTNGPGTSGQCGRDRRRGDLYFCGEAMNQIINPSWRYRYVGPNVNLKGKPCYGCKSICSGKRIWSGGPGPRNALVWFPHLLPIGFVVVPGRALRKARK